MRILFLTENLFPDVMGGSGRVVAETAQRLAARGHDLRIVTRRVADTAATETRAGIAIARYPAGGALAGVAAIRQLMRRQLEQAPADVLVICQPLPGCAFLGGRRRRAAPVVRDFYGPWDDEYRVRAAGRAVRRLPLAIRLGMLVRRRMDRYVLGRANAVRVLSEYTAAMVRAICPAAADRIRLIPAGVDTERFRPAADRAAARRALGLPAERPLVFTVRNLTPRMGLDVLIEATAIARRDAPELLLVIGGEGPQRAALTAQAARLGLAEQVRLAGRIPDEQLPAYYQAADLFVLPTQTLEGFGLVTLEAMACGAAVLATPNGGTREILGPYADRFLFRDATAATMGAQIGAARRAPAELVERGRAARQIACAQYDWEKRVNELEDFYQELLRRRSA